MQQMMLLWYRGQVLEVLMEVVAVWFPDPLTSRGPLNRNVCSTCGSWLLHQFQAVPELFGTHCQYVPR